MTIRIALTKEEKRMELMMRTLSKNVTKKLVKSYEWSVAFCGAETWTLRRKEENRPQAFEMWVWRRMENV
jgi:hypothetical protein